MLGQVELKSKLFLSPFTLYTITFAFVLLIYKLRWSPAYPDLSWTLLFFLVTTMLFMFILGTYFQSKNYFNYTSVPYNLRWVGKNIIFCYILLIIEFIHAGTIPIFAILFGKGFKYTEFGLPFIHVIFVNYISFLALYIFHSFRSANSNKDKRNLFLYYLMCCVPGILFFNRGIILSIFFGSFIIYLLSVPRKIFMRTIVTISLFFILIFYLFGLMGNIRTDISKKKYIILEISGASEEFINSDIPKEFYWGYLYIASPLGNLQNGINKNPPVYYSIEDFASLICFDFLPEIIGKRLISLLKLEYKHCIRVFSAITVATCYDGPFSYFGWLGMILHFIFGLFFIFINLLLIPKNSPYFITGVTILSTIVILNTFDNMYVFMGQVPQLFFVIAYSFKYWKKRKQYVV